MPPKKPEDEVVPGEVIERRILLIRGHKVMLDRDLAALYRVKPIALRQAVKRNSKRFSLPILRCSSPKKKLRPWYHKM